MKRPTPPAPESNPLFDGLPPAAIAALLAKGKYCLLPAEQQLIHQGSSPGTVYLQLDGFARKYLVTQDGKEVTLAFTPPGEWLGIAALFDTLPHATQISSQTELAVLGFPIAEVRQFVKQYPQCMEWLLRHSITLTRQIVSVFVQGNNESPGFRLAKRLTEVTGYLGVPAEISASQADLGMWCGLSRQSVAKTLAAWEAAGIVETGYGVIRILDEQPLLDIIGRQH